MSPLILETFKAGLGRAGREAVGVECGQVSLEKVLKYFARQLENPKGQSKRQLISSGVITDLVRIHGDGHLF